MGKETIQLDETQDQVVAHEGGPLLVLGSPGTGKTTVLCERWVRLATDTGEPHRILLLVPTRERALELREDLFYRLPNQAVLEVPVHTWHALAYHLVTRYYRRLGYAQPPVRLSAGAQSAVVRELLATEDPKAWDLYAEILSTDAFVEEVADFCLRAGHRGFHDHDLEQLARQRPEHAAVAKFALRYRNRLRADASLDYAELVVAATRLLGSDDDIKEAVHRRFTHVLVDDAQELAPAQLHLLCQLDTSRLVCAGDPDSAIEAFRGADPTWLDRFDSAVGPHDRITLSTCHRYGKAIGDVATSLITHAPNPAPHRAATFTGPDDGTAEFRSYATMAGELEAVAREIRTEHLLRKVAYDDMAILLAQPSTYGHAVERVLKSFGVPCRTISPEGLRTQPAVRAVLDLCRLALEPEPTDELCKAVLSSPMFGMHPYRVRELEREARMRRGTTLAALLTDDTIDDTTELRAVRDAARVDPSETADGTFQRIFETSAWCIDLAARRFEDSDAATHINALIALNKTLAHFVESQPGATMRTYLATAADAVVSTDTWRRPGSEHGVHVLSLHAAKGREWDVVCVLGVAEGHIPKAHRAQGLFDPWAILDTGGAIERAQAQLAEERRTLYVAMSRPRRRLLTTTSPGVRKSVPSRFCEEAFGPLPEPISAGDEGTPLTLAEAASRHRRTLAHPEASDDEKAAATAALARIATNDGSLDPSTWWWRRDWTVGSPLYPDGKLTTSYSRISRYDECPLRYVLESVLGLDPQTTYQMKFGSLVHRIIELADATVGTIKTWQEALDMYKKEFVEHHKDDYPNRVFARTYYRYGVQSLKRWWNTERAQGETVEVEYSFDDLDFDGHTIRGRIDRVAKTPKGLVLSDYKTGRNAAQWDEAKESLQLAIYYRAAKVRDDLKTHGEPQVMQLIYPGIEHVSRIDGAIECCKRYQTPDEAEEALGRLGEILDNAASEAFAPSPEADCRWCRMKPLCPRWPEGREVPR